MNPLKQVLAICGSTRAASANLHLIHAIAGIAEHHFSVHVFDGLADLPHFNPDIQEVPYAVCRFKKQVREADGVLICTPEYAMGVPGTLKNALDWTVSGMEFSGRPVALVTASSLGHKAHASLVDTLNVIEAKMARETQLLISFVRAKISADGQITDQATFAQCRELVAHFHALLHA